MQTKKQNRAVHDMATGWRNATDEGRIKFLSKLDINDIRPGVSDALHQLLYDIDDSAVPHD